MAFNVTFWTFAKKDNSTARPSGAGAVYACTLKDSSGVVAPAIELNIGMTTSPAALNYCYIPDFNRYYFVTEWNFDRGLWSATLSCDVLASYKPQIGAGDFYILRSSAAFNGLINDLMYPLTYDVHAGLDLPANYWWTLGAGVNSGCFIVGVLAKIDSSSQYGGVTYLGFEWQQFKSFTQYLFADDLSYYDGQNLGIDVSLAKMIINPFEYITSVTWLPTMPAAATIVSSFHIGFWEYPGSCYIIAPATVLQYSASITPHAHPQALTRGNYLNTNPYTIYSVFLPRIGAVPVDASVLADASLITVNLTVDVITGQGVYVITATPDIEAQEDPIVIGRYTAQIGVTVQLASTGFTMGGSNSAMGDISKLVSDGARLASGSVMGGVSAIGDVVGLFTPHIDNLQSQGGYMGLAGAVQPYMQHIHYLIVDEDNACNGRPLCEIRKPQSLGGYMIIRDADISLAATETEIQEVKRYLESGFYYE